MYYIKKKFLLGHIVEKSFKTFLEENSILYKFNDTFI